MKVRAIKPGFCDGTRRREGEVFEFSGAKLGKWMVPADAEVALSSDLRDAPPAGTAEAVKVAHKRRVAAVKQDAAKASGGGTGDQDVI